MALDPLDGPRTQLDADLVLRPRPGAPDDLELALTLRGDLDVATSSELDGLLHLLELAHLPVTVDLAGLTFADSRGLTPLVEATRRRRSADGPPLWVVVLGTAAGRVFGLLGVAALPEIDVAAWDALRSRPTLTPARGLDPPALVGAWTQDRRRIG